MCWSEERDAGGTAGADGQSARGEGERGGGTGAGALLPYAPPRGTVTAPLEEPERQPGPGQSSEAQRAPVTLSERPEDAPARDQAHQLRH